MNKKSRVTKALSVAAGLLWIGAATGAVIYDNGAGSLTSVLLSDPDPIAAVQFLSDDFVLQQAASVVSDIHWT
jgi:ligand-binding sensor domain-containing protein